jgi:hypothetical protein
MPRTKPVAQVEEPEIELTRRKVRAGKTGA